MATKQKTPALSAPRKESGPSARKAKNKAANEARRMANVERKKAGQPTTREARAIARANDPAVKARRLAHEQERTRLLAEAKAKGDAEARARRAERFASEAYVLASAAETMRRIHAA